MREGGGKEGGASRRGAEQEDRNPVVGLPQRAGKQNSFRVRNGHNRSSLLQIRTSPARFRCAEPETEPAIEPESESVRRKAPACTRHKPQT
jgi:hypothetical protein